MPPRMAAGLKILSIVAVVVLATLMTACSPSVFFGGDSKDASISQSVGYSRINTACSGMDLSSSVLDVPTFVQVIECFNANGSIEPLARLIRRLQRLEPRRLQSVVLMLNRYILTNKTMMYEFDSTLAALNGDRRIDEAYRQVGRLFENRELLTSMIALFRQTYSANGPLRNGILESMERIAPQLTPENTARALDLGLALATSPAFERLIHAFGRSSQFDRTLEKLTTDFHLYMNDRDPQHVPLGKSFAVQIAEGNFYSITDEVMGRDAFHLRDGVVSFSSIFSTVFRRETSVDGRLIDGATIDGISSLYHYLHRRLSCFQGATGIDDMDLNLLRELSLRNTSGAADFYRRTNVLLLAASRAFCDYPPELSRYYDSMFVLSNSPAVEITTAFVKALEKRGLAGLFVDVVSDTGSGYAGGPRENTAGIKVLFPLFTELTEREIWEDFFFLVTAPSERDRRFIEDTFRFLIEPKLSSQANVYDVMMGAVAQARPQQLVRFVSSLKRYTDSTAAEDLFLVPFLQSVRSILYINDVHPILNLFRDVMASARENQEYFETLFSIAEMDEFGDTLTLVSDMAKDGRLKELFSSLASLFKKFSLQGRTGPIHQLPEPPFIGDLRHTWSSADVSRKSVLTLPREMDPNPCRQVSLSHSFDQYTDEQLNTYLRCLGQGGNNSEIIRGINFLRRSKLSDDRSFWQMQMDWVNSLGFSREQTQDLANRFVTAMSTEDDNFFRVIKRIPLWVETHDVVHPFMNTVHGVMGRARSSVRPVLGYFADVLRRTDFPELLKFVRTTHENGKKLKNIPETRRASGLSPEVVSQLSEWVRQYEPGAHIHQRVPEIWDDYENSLTSSSSRREWNRQEFFDLVKPLFGKLSDPALSAPDKMLRQALLNMMRTFSKMKPGLPQWLITRSEDPRPILYYYPGESSPRVRVVNSLDRLELLLLNSDFEYLISMKAGYHFLTQIAEAWGDEPREEWPAEIQRRYPSGSHKRPFRLDEAARTVFDTVSIAEKVIGFPGSLRPFPFWLKARVFNLSQVSSVIYENLPGAEGPSAGGLKLLRNLLYELYSSTPVAERNSSSGWKHHFSLATRLGELGLLRQLGRSIHQNPQAWTDILNFLVQAANSPAAPSILETLFSERDLSRTEATLVWQLLNQFFDGPSLRNLAYYFGASSGSMHLGKNLAVLLDDLLVAGGQELPLRVKDLAEVPETVQALVLWLRAFYEENPSGISGDSRRLFEAFVRESISDRLVWTSVLKIVLAADFSALAKTQIPSDGLPVGTWLLDYFSQSERDSSAAVLREFLAQRLAGGEVEEILHLIEKSPEEVYQLLLAISHSISQGDLIETIHYTRRSLSR